jgi:hypothetical protein
MTLRDKLVIKQDGSDRELFMSFGLLNELSRLASNPEAVALFAIDPEIRDAVRKSLLAERKAGGKIISPIDDPDELNVSIDDTERMLKWAMDHVLGFFVRSMTSVADVTREVEPKLTALASSMNGSND